MKKLICICLCLCLAFLFGCNEVKTSDFDDGMEMSDVLVTNSNYIESIEIYKNSVCTNVDPSALPRDIIDLFELIGKKQYSMGAIDTSLSTSRIDVYHYLLNKDVEELGGLEQLDTNNTYIMVHFTMPFMQQKTY